MNNEPQNIAQLNTVIEENQQKAAVINNYSSLTSAEFLLNIDAIQATDSLTAQALFSKHRQQLIDIFENKINNAPTVGNGKYKDYTAVQDLIDQALKTN